MRASSFSLLFAPGLRAAVAAAAVAAVLGLGPVRSEAQDTDAVISFGREAAKPDTESLGGNPATINDAVNVDTGDLVFSRLSELGLLGDLDGYHQLPNGNVLFSSEPYVFGVPDVGLIHPGDVIEYHLSSDSFSRFFNNNNFVGLGNVDAVSIAPSGNLLLSTKGGGNLPGLGAFQDGDVVEWDGAAATLYLAEGDIFTEGANNDVDAIHSLDEDEIIISPRTAGGGGIGANRLDYGSDAADLFQINLVTGIATRFLDGEDIWDGATRQTDAAFVVPPVECPCFDAAFLAREISNVSVCRVRTTASSSFAVAIGTDADGCGAVARSRISFDMAGNPMGGTCFSNDGDAQPPAPGCVFDPDDSTLTLPVDLAEYLSCAGLIDDYCP